MKSFIVFALFVAAAVAAPAGLDAGAVIEEYHSTNIGLDGYDTGYKTSNGISANEQAQLKNVGTDNEALEVRGQYSYIGDDGVTYTITYISNEFGFQPQGAHLPQSPQ